MIGIQNPDGNECYVKKDGDPAIYLIASASVTNWKKSPGDFRDKTVAEFPPDQVTQLTLLSPNQSLVLKKENEDWKLTQPQPLNVDPYKVEDILWKIHSAQVKQFVDDSPKDLKTYGLDKPTITAEIKTNAGKLFSISLADRGPSPDLVYGKTSDKSFIFAVDTSVEQGLIISNVNDLRDRTLFRFLVDDIQSMQLISKTTLTLAKEKDNWFITTPKKIKADSDKIQDILWKVNGLKVKDFIDDSPKDLKIYGLTNPATKVLLTDKNKKTYTLSLGDTTKAGDAVYGKTDATPAVFSVDTDILSFVRPNENELIAVDTTKKGK